VLARTRPLELDRGQNGHSLLDSEGRIGAHGRTGRGPSPIMVNYGANDVLHTSNPSDTFACINQCLGALRNCRMHPGPFSSGWKGV